MTVTVAGEPEAMTQAMLRPAPPPCLRVRADAESGLAAAPSGRPMTQWSCPVASGWASAGSASGPNSTAAVAEGPVTTVNGTESKALPPRRLRPAAAPA